MSSTANLSIFPSPSKHNTSNVRQPQLNDLVRTSTELQGLALHLVATTAPQPKIQQAKERTQHSIPIQRPLQDPAIYAPKQLVHRRKRSSTPNLKTVVETTGQRSFAYEDQQRAVSALRPAIKNCKPISTSFSSTYSKRTSMSTTLVTPASTSIETPATSYTTHSFDTQLDSNASSKLAMTSTAPTMVPGREGAASAPTEKMKDLHPPRSHSLRSASTAVSYRASVAAAPPNNSTVAHSRSIFPQYDVTKPLTQQQYYPSQAVTAPSLPVAVKQPNNYDSVDRKALERKDSGIVAPPSYECIPEPDHDDLTTLWAASTRLGTCGGRKVQLSFRQTPTRSFCIALNSRKLFSMDIHNAESKDDPTVLSIQKINPSNDEPQLLSNLSLPPSSRSQAAHATCNTPIFPHQAAVDALTAASNSPQAMAIARFDPMAKSRAAESLANEAVSDAHRNYTSELVRTTRARDSVGTVSARYKLQHPIAGELAITVERSVPVSRIYTTHLPQVKVTIHHPSATPAAISADSLALMTIDFARNACVIDLPGILSLEADYMLDSAISALFAVAVMESENNVQQTTMTFAAPPKVAITEPKKKRSVLRKSKKAEKSKSNGSGLWPLRKTGVREIDEPVEEMPSVAKGALAILELGIHGAFWALEKGFKSLDERTSAARQQ